MKPEHPTHQRYDTLGMKSNKVKLGILAPRPLQFIAKKSIGELRRATRTRRWLERSPPYDLQLGVKAPKQVPVYREEIYERIKKEKKVGVTNIPL